MNITLIDEEGKLVSNDLNFDAARKMAENLGRDLILINGKTNTYRIANAGKLKYEQKQKEKQQRATRRTHKIKEVQISPNIEQHDLNTKINRIKEFLSKGFKTKVKMVLHGRQQAFRNVALEKLVNLTNDIINQNIAVLDDQIKQDGRDLVAYLLPKT